MKRPEKEDSRRIRSEIDRVLWEVWDPIGVNDEPMARDEYANYVGDVYELLIGGKEDKEIRRYLQWVSEERMCVGKGDESATIKALRLIKLT
jgi:hypothetical protein